MTPRNSTNYVYLYGIVIIAKKLNYFSLIFHQTITFDRHNQYFTQWENQQPESSKSQAYFFSIDNSMPVINYSSAAGDTGTKK